MLNFVKWVWKRLVEIKEKREEFKWGDEEDEEQGGNLQKFVGKVVVFGRKMKWTRRGRGRLTARGKGERRQCQEE
jgi:hypothetical protein